MGVFRKIMDSLAPKHKPAPYVQKIPEGFPFTAFYTHGAHRYRRPGERVDVSFVDPQTGVSRRIIDNMGNICNFPGMIKEESWVRKVASKKYLKPVVRFRASFEKWDAENYIMLWEIQPDGRYWADEDGFGMENDEEITLYAFINQKGEFKGPFRIYRVGDRNEILRARTGMY